MGVPGPGDTLPVGAAAEAPGGAAGWVALGGLDGGVVLAGAWAQAGVAQQMTVLTHRVRMGKKFMGD
jgi:hypothetical protein